MSQSEKCMLEANIKLSDLNNERIRDIEILISYIRGNKSLKEEVRSIIKYYSSNNMRKVKYEKRNK